MKVTIDIFKNQQKECYLKRKALRSWESRNYRLDYVQGIDQEMLSLLHCPTEFGSTDRAILAVASVFDNRKVQQVNSMVRSKIETKSKRLVAPKN